MRGLFRTFASAKHISINRKLKIKTTMNKTLCRALLLCLLTLPCTSAVADSDVTAEKNKQNTPDGWTAVQLPNIPTITEANTFNIKDYGADPSKADNTKAIQAALNAVPTTGGMVVIPAGTWMFGSESEMTSKTEVLSIKSKTVLHLCAGATLKLVAYGTAPNNKYNPQNETFRHSRTSRLFS